MIRKLLGTIPTFIKTSLQSIRLLLLITTMSPSFHTSAILMSCYCTTGCLIYDNQQLFEALLQKESSKQGNLRACSPQSAIDQGLPRTGFFTSNLLIRCGYWYHFNFLEDGNQKVLFPFPPVYLRRRPDPWRYLTILQEGQVQISIVKIAFFTANGQLIFDVSHKVQMFVSNTTNEELFFLF